MTRTPNSLSAPFEALAAAGRRTLPNRSEAQRGCRRQFCTAGFADVRASGPELLVASSQRHGMVRWLTDAARDTWGPQADAVARCELVVRAHALAGLKRLHELGGILECLERAAIPAVLFKGPALAAWLYRDPCARHYADFDLLIRKRDRPRAVAALAELGFAPAMSTDALCR